jgi:hypothetical protein
MAMELTIKNTFLDLVGDEQEEACAVQKKRSTSLPRSWKPACLSEFKLSDAVAIASDASTGDSDECLSVGDNEVSSGILSSSASDCASSEHMEQADDVPTKSVLCLDSLCDTELGSSPKEKLSWSDLSDHLFEDFMPKKVLCLSNMVEEAKVQRTKLKAKARMFEPISMLPQDMRNVLNAAQAALCTAPKITNVQVSEEYFGGTTKIVGSYAKGSLQVFELVKILSIVKMALLDAAAESSNTYIVGYLKQPFSNVGANGFSGRLGTVSAADEETVCWDTYQKGFCPRPATCRWCHPCDADLMKIVVMLNETWD